MPFFAKVIQTNNPDFDDHQISANQVPRIRKPFHQMVC